MCKQHATPRAHTGSASEPGVFLMNDRTRVGFVGVGVMGQCAHLRNYVHLPECEVIALAELRAELGQRVAKRYGVSHVYRTWEDMVEKEKLDALVASQPFTRHGLILSGLLRTGLPVFSEKPLASSVEIGEEIVTAEREGGGFLMVGYHKRSDPATMYAKDQIDGFCASGELGKITYIRITMPAGDWIAGGFYDLIDSDEPPAALECDPPSEGMNGAAARKFIEFSNYYIHQINLMRHLMGSPYHIRHVAENERVLAVEGENGVCGTIEMSPYVTSIDWHEQALVCFEHGYVKIILPAPVALNRPGSVEIMKDPGNGSTPITLFPSLPWNHAMRQQAVNFVRAVRGEIAPLCTATEALEDLKNAMEYLNLWEMNQVRAAAVQQDPRLAEALK